MKAPGRKTWRQCRSKDRYDDQIEADRVAAHIKRTRGVDLRSYECPEPECNGGFHLTKQVFNKEEFDGSQ